MLTGLQYRRGRHRLLAHSFTLQISFMKKFTIKLNATAMWYFRKWVANYLTSIDRDDQYQLGKLVLAELYTRNVRRFQFIEAWSMRLHLSEAIALRQMMETELMPVDPYEAAIFRQVFEALYKNTTEQLCDLEGKLRRTQSTVSGA